MIVIKLKKLKQFSWYCVKHKLPHRIDSLGIDLADAFQKLPKSQKVEAVNDLKFIKVDGIRL